MLLAIRKWSCQKGICEYKLSPRLISRFCVWGKQKSAKRLHGPWSERWHTGFVKLFFPPWLLHTPPGSCMILLIARFFSFSHLFSHHTFPTSSVLLIHCYGILPTYQPAVLQFRQVSHAEPCLLPEGQCHDRWHGCNPQPAGKRSLYFTHQLDKYGNIKRLLFGL